MRYSGYGSCKNAHHAHLHGRVCAEKSCTWQCRGSHPVLAAASPDARPRLLFCVFSLHYFKGASFAGFGALRARPALLLSAAGTTFSHSPLRASLAQMFVLHNVRHAVKLL